MPPKMVQYKYSILATDDMMAVPGFYVINPFAKCSTGRSKTGNEEALPARDYVLRFSELVQCRKWEV